jgi:anion-transporting  ArsA/GET3 family ATPase
VPDQPRLHVVTGKGGTGKTTVAAALAIALARRGKRVLLAEVEGRQGIAQTFDTSPLGTAEVRLYADHSGGEVWGLSVDAKAALLEYLQIFYKLGRAGNALEKVGAIDFATTIAPGVRDVLLIGKVYEAVGRTTGAKRHQGALVWDAVVLDAPPTGRVVRFLNVNAEVADVARVGPIRSQADSITRLLHSPRTAVHLVTLLEEMPVQETLDAAEELRRIHIPLGAFVVNLVRTPLLDEADVEALAVDDGLADRVGEDLQTAGVKGTPAIVAGLLSEGRDHVERLALEAEQAELIANAGLPVHELPFLDDGIEGGGLGRLADELEEMVR